MSGSEQVGEEGLQSPGGWEAGPIPSVDGWVGVVWANCRLASVLMTPISL